MEDYKNIGKGHKIAKNNKADRATAQYESDSPGRRSQKGKLGTKKGGAYNKGTTRY